MYLSKTEEKILDGEYGEAKALALKLIVALGEVFKAKKLISIENAQIAGISYKTIGDAGLEFISDLYSKNAKFIVPTTLNPAGMDLEKWREIGIPEDFAEKQLKIIFFLESMGAKKTCTCTPYLIGIKPKYNSHLAWAESSAVIFANSVFGAKTNREGGPSALASAIVGKTAMYGMHLKNERQPTHIVKVETSIINELEFSLLGYVIGEKISKGVPFINKFKGRVNLDALKALGAGIATSSGISLFHLEGATPEAKHLKKNSLKGLEKVTIEKKDIEDAKEKLSIEDYSTHILLGCPHLSFNELKKIANLVEGKSLTKNLWCFTSRKIYEKAEKKGFIKKIENAGGKVIRDTCMVVAPLENIGVLNAQVNSSKAAYYLTSLSNIKVNLKPLEEI
ncbi:MAG: aconitase X catalytic domain-containing protein [Candidatus Bathyarchaeia archaeon]|nr:aconitase X catalytic domain-containing protein [Candidatus Bathyarchaeota archaeon]